MRENPKHTLSLLCEALDVDYKDVMLRWDTGNPTDDVWSKYQWYDTARNSTQFNPYKATDEVVPERLHNLLAKCNEIYGELYKYRLI